MDYIGNFIDRNRDFFSKNPRLSMMVRILDKIKEDRKKEFLIMQKNSLMRTQFLNGT